MATITIKNAYAGQPAASAVLLYTCPASPSSTKARVVKCTTCNDTTTAMTYKFYKVPVGASVDDAYLIYQDRAIGSKDTDDNPAVVGQVLDSGDMIYCHPSAATQLSVMLDVIEEI